MTKKEKLNKFYSALWKKTKKIKEVEMNEVCVLEKIKVLALDCCLGLLVLLGEGENEEKKNPAVSYSIMKGVDACRLIIGILNTTDGEKRIFFERKFRDYWGVGLDDAKKIAERIEYNLEELLNGKVTREEIEKIMNSIIIFTSQQWQKIIEKMLEGGEIEWDEILGEI